MANNSKRGAANIRMHRAIKKIAQGTPVSVAMRESGYSAPYSKNPQYLVRTEAFQRMLHENGLALDDVTKVHRKLLQSKREEIAQRAVDTAYKVHGVYDRTKSSTSVTPIQIVINPPQQRSTRSVDGVEIVERYGGEDATPEK